MTVAVYIAVYVGLPIFLTGGLHRILKYARTPFHQHRDPYSFPQEESGRVDRVGFYFEPGE